MENGKTKKIGDIVLLDRIIEFTKQTVLYSSTIQKQMTFKYLKEKTPAYYIGYTCKSEGEIKYLKYSEEKMKYPEFYKYKEETYAHFVPQRTYTVIKVIFHPRGKVYYTLPSFVTFLSFIPPDIESKLGKFPKFKENYEN